MEPVIKKYVVLSETGVILTGPDDTVYAKGTTLELNPEDVQVKALVESGSIGEIMPDEDLEDYVVTEEFLKENPAMAEQGIVVGDTIRVPKEEIKESTEEETTDTVEEEAAPETEADTEVAVDAGPKMSYRGQEVISSGIRTVNEKDYHHFRLADGSEVDVTDEEYETALKAG